MTYVECLVANVHKQQSNSKPLPPFVGLGVIHYFRSKSDISSALVTLLSICLI
jgi:hypothetical protein